MVRHDATGAMGLVVNRPLQQVALAQLLERFGMVSEHAEGSVLVHWGGPVEPGKAFVLHTPDYRSRGHHRRQGARGVHREPEDPRGHGHAGGTAPSDLCHRLRGVGAGPTRIGAGAGRLADGGDGRASALRRRLREQVAAGDGPATDRSCQRPGGATPLPPTPPTGITRRLYAGLRRHGRRSKGGAQRRCASCLIQPWSGSLSDSRRALRRRRQPTGNQAYHGWATSRA